MAKPSIPQRRTPPGNAKPCSSYQAGLCPIRLVLRPIFVDGHVTPAAKSSRAMTAFVLQGIPSIFWLSLFAEIWADMTDRKKWIIFAFAAIAWPSWPWQPFSWPTKAPADW